MPGKRSRLWRSNSQALVVSLATLMHTAWIAPLMAALTLSDIIYPHFVMPAWMVLALLLAPRILTSATEKWRWGQWLVTIAGLTVAFWAMTRTLSAPLNDRYWFGEFRQHLDDWANGIPAVVIAPIMTTALWRVGMGTRWITREGLWSGFVTGAVLIGLLILFNAPQGESTLAIEGWLAIFVLCGLLAVAVRNTSETLAYERRRGSRTPGMSRPWALSVGLIVVAILLLGWLTGLLLSPAAIARIWNALTPIRQAIGWAIRTVLTGIAYAVVWLLTPLINLLRQASGSSENIPFDLGGGLGEMTRFDETTPIGGAIPNFFPILFMALLALGLIWLLWSAYRRRYHPEADSSLATEVRESLFSWSVLQDQLRNAWRWGGHRSQGLLLLAMPEDTSPRASIRERYRAMLRVAYDQGHGRRRGATPHRYAQVLGAHWLASRDAIAQLTEVYYGARYGAEEPRPDDVKQAETAHAELTAFWEQQN